MRSRSSRAFSSLRTSSAVTMRGVVAGARRGHGVVEGLDEAVGQPDDGGGGAEAVRRLHLTVFLHARPTFRHGVRNGAVGHGNCSTRDGASGMVAAMSLTSPTGPAAPSSSWASCPTFRPMPRPRWQRSSARAPLAARRRGPARPPLVQHRQPRLDGSGPARVGGGAPGREHAAPGRHRRRGRTRARGDAAGPPGGRQHCLALHRSRDLSDAAAAALRGPQLAAARRGPALGRHRVPGPSGRIGGRGRGPPGVGPQQGQAQLPGGRPVAPGRGRGAAAGGRRSRGSRSSSGSRTARPGRSGRRASARER